MKKRLVNRLLRLWLPALALLVAVTLGAPPAALALGVTVTVNSPASAGVGGTLAVRVDISAVKDFDAALYRVDFDPALLGLAGVADGNIAGTAIPVASTAMTTPGKLAIVNNVPGIAGVTGSGYLCEITFTVLAAGSCALTMPILSVSDKDANLIPAAAVPDTVTTVDSPAVPPAVSTGAATGITTATAILNGSLTAKGSAATVNVHFNWGISAASLTNATTAQAMTAAGAFSASISGLAPGTTYYFQAIAAGDGTPANGAVLPFTTQIVPPPPPPPAPELEPVYEPEPTPTPTPEPTPAPSVTPQAPATPEPVSTAEPPPAQPTTTPPVSEPQPTTEPAPATGPEPIGEPEPPPGNDITPWVFAGVSLAALLGGLAVFLKRGVDERRVFPW